MRTIRSDGTGRPAALALFAWLLALVVLTPLPWAAVGAREQVTEVITLNFRAADDMLALIRPLVPEPGVVSGSGSHLVIRTSADNLREVLNVVRTLDRAPRQLLITVRQGVARESQATGRDARVGNDAGAAWRGTTADGGGVVVDTRDARTGVRARIYSTRSRASGNDVQRLQVLEGSDAFIFTGEQVPLREQAFVSDGDVRASAQTLRYRDVGSGFRVRARVDADGSGVTLTVRPTRERLDTRHARGTDPVIERQAAATTLRVRPGEWVELGGSRADAGRDDNAIVRSVRARDLREHHIALKVDVLD